MQQQPQPQPPALTPQQEAIREVRSRYEQGILNFNQFEYALNALLQAQTPEACEAIVDELPTTASSSALDLPAAPAAPATPRRSRRGPRWMVAILAGVQRMKRPWRLAEETQMVAFMGGMELDLSLAALPQQGVIRIFTTMGGFKLYVPRSLNVTVHGLLLLGGVNVMGEGNGGVISFVHEESYGQGASPEAANHLEIQIFALMGGMEIVQTDGPVITGGLPDRSAPLLASPSGSYDRHAAPELRKAERHAWKEERKAERQAWKEARHQ